LSAIGLQADTIWYRTGEFYSEENDESYCDTCEESHIAIDIQRNLLDNILSRHILLFQLGQNSLIKSKNLKYREEFLIYE